MQIFNFQDEEVPKVQIANQQTPLPFSSNRRKKKTQKESSSYQGLYVKNQLFQLKGQPHMLQIPTTFTDTFPVQQAFQQDQIQQRPGRKREKRRKEKNQSKEQESETKEEKEVLHPQKNIFEFDEFQATPQYSEPDQQWLVKEICDLSQLGSDCKKIAVGHLGRLKKMKCVLERDRSGLNLFSPQFRLTLEQTGQFILGAKKKITFQPDYHFSLKKGEFSPEGDWYLGKLKNEDEGKYALFEAGQDEPTLRITYVPNVMKGPRKLIVEVPGLEGCTLVSKKPRWNQIIRSFVLNFMGRVKMASVKNFILTEREKEENVLLLGKVDDVYFHLDFGRLSPLQAVAVALSSFDYTGS